MKTKTIMLGAMFATLFAFGTNGAFAIDEMECDVTPGMTWEDGMCMAEEIADEMATEKGQAKNVDISSIKGVCASNKAELGKKDVPVYKIVNGNPSNKDPSNKYCWCKNTESTGTLHIFRYSYEDFETCEKRCSNACKMYASSNPEFYEKVISLK